MSEAVQDKKFSPQMTVREALDVHPRIADVFAAFQLGGCPHCGIAAFETVEQVCMAYGVELEAILDVMESLVAREELKAQTGSETEAQA